MWDICRKRILKLKSRDASFVHNLFFKCLIVLKFCIEHGINTTINTNAQMLWINEISRDLSSNEFPMITLYNGNINAPRYWPFVQGIHRTKASDAELWCFFWSALE